MALNRLCDFTTEARGLVSRKATVDGLAAAARFEAMRCLKTSTVPGPPPERTTVTAAEQLARLRAGCQQRLRLVRALVAYVKTMEWPHAKASSITVRTAHAF
ncbi:MAG: hypothetical protein AAFR23_08360 [Pseudomonadota bacterium]